MQDVQIPVPDGSISVWHRPAAPNHPTAVLVHGLTGTSRWWTEVIGHLPEELGLIATDVRGRGASFDAPPPYDLETAADDIGRSIDHFDLDSAIVVGYSMGGWIAALFAARNPNKVARLLLVDGGLPVPGDPKADADEIIEAVVGPSLARLDVRFPDKPAFYEYWKQHPALRRHWDESMGHALDFELTSAGDGYTVRINPDAVREAARQITVDPETKDAGRKVGVRSHLIVVERGTADQEGGMIPLATAEEVVRSLPNMTMEYLPEINHYTLILGAGATAVASAITHSAS